MQTDFPNRPAVARGDLSTVRTVQQYAAQAIGRAELSRMASEAAMDKATRPDVRELAGYELMEAKAIISVLRDLGAPAPQLGPDAKGVLNWSPAPPRAPPSTGPISRPSARTTPICAT